MKLVRSWAKLPLWTSVLLRYSLQSRDEGVSWAEPQDGLRIGARHINVYSGFANKIFTCSRFRTNVVQ